MTGSITSTGLGSGLDVSGIVSKLVAAEQTPAANQLNGKEASYQAQISALGTVKSSLSDFRSTLDALQHASSFSKLDASSSDTSVVTATAEDGADVANYQVMVKQLAQSQTLASKAFASPSDVIGTGTITIQFGTTSYTSGTPPVRNGFTVNPDKAALTITVDATNNSLSGLRDAINKANAGVRASIVNDGSGNRLVLNSTDSGAANSMEITVSDPGNTGLSAFAFNTSSAQMTETRAAQDALVNIDGLDVTSSSNTVSSALTGVTLNLLQVSNAAVSVDVAQNTEDLTQAIQGFVDKFNAAVDTIQSVTSYDPKTKTAGTLIGDASVRGAMFQLRSLISQQVAGLDGSIRSLVEIGIKTGADGKLTLDKTVLDQAIQTSKSDVVALFAPLGVPSDSGVSFVSGDTSTTQAGTYALDVSAAATHGALNGAAGPSLVVDGTNDTLAVKVDGVVSGTITLARSASYTPDQLAAELQSKVNGDTALKTAGVSVSVEYDTAANRFVLQSQKYGSASTVEVTDIGAAGSGATVAGLAVGAGTAGQDVAATLDGTAATGSGRQISGAGGLTLLMLDDRTGSRGTVRYSNGLASRFDSVLSGILDSGGSMDTRIEGLQKSIDQIGQDRTDLNDRMQALQDRLLAQFNAMDQLVGQLQATGQYLTQQLSALPYASIYGSSGNSKS